MFPTFKNNKNNKTIKKESIYVFQQSLSEYEATDLASIFYPLISRRTVRIRGEKNVGYSEFCGRSKCMLLMDYRLKFQCLFVDLRVLIGPYFKFCQPAWLTCNNSLRKCTPLKAKLDDQALALQHTLDITILRLKVKNHALHVFL